MNKRFKAFLSLLLVFNFLLDFNIPIASANNNKTITVTFATTPTSATASISDLKYNKKFALSYVFDDGLSYGYEPAFKYLNGGYSSYLGQYFGGLYFTDGAGNNVPFRGGFAFYSRNSNYSDIHVSTPSYLTWANLQESFDYGWDILNHGYTSATVTDPNRVYYTNDPGGHTVGPLDYAYELTQNNIDISSHINLKNDSGSIVGPFQTYQVVLPNGDDNYIQPAFDNGFNGIYAQDPNFSFDGTSVTAPRYTNVSNSISDNRFVMSRWFDYETRYLSGGEFPNGLYNNVDNIASVSNGSTRYWGQEFTHQVVTSSNPSDWNGGISWNTWKDLMDHIENTYGRYGNDSAWIAGPQEVYEYTITKQKVHVTQNLSGNQLTIQIDSTDIPNYFRHNALSFNIQSDAAISSINYGSDITYHTDNKNTKLINIEWGNNTYHQNDISRVAGLVSTAQTNKTLSSVNIARTYVNMLNDETAKNYYTGLLDAITVPLRTWYVKIRGDYSTGAGATSYSSTAATFTSPNHINHNWNKFGMVSNSTITPVGNDLMNLKDADGLISSISLSNTAPFNFGSLGTTGTGNNSGLYPDSVLTYSAQIYAASTTPAKIKIYGLDNSKNYNIKLFGYTSSSSKTGDNATTTYTIGGVSKDLYVRENISSYVLFSNIQPTSGGIEVTVQPKVSSWGYGLLNAMEIIENLLPIPTNFSYPNQNTFTIGTPINSISPTINGLEVSYSVSPALPDGLTLNTSTGVISGTPTAVTATNTYVITATNTGGSAVYGTTLTVNDIAPSGLSYLSNSQTYTIGNSISALSPTISGGAPNSYSVSPALPDGLTLNTSTGVISGTPTAVTATNTYVITATNTGGSTTFSMDIKVNDIAPANLTYSSPNIFTKNTNITALSPTISGGAPNSYSVSPALPDGLTLNTSTGVISGTPTAVTATNTYVITATNTGGSTTFSMDITIGATAPMSFSYSSPNVYTVNTAITSLSPVVYGENITYSMSNLLPDGLTLNTSTGVISGTPTAVTPIGTYTVIATNEGGSSSYGVVITVNDIAPSGLSYLSNSQTYTIGNSISALSPTISGGAPNSYSVSPALPDGLTLNTSTGVISGTPTAVTATNTYVITATNTGGSTTFSMDIKVVFRETPVVTLDNISIIHTANKTSYKVGDVLDISGLVIRGNYSDSSTKIENITSDNISGFDSSSEKTKQVLTITINGKNTTYNISISNNITQKSSVNSGSIPVNKIVVNQNISPNTKLIQFNDQNTIKKSSNNNFVFVKKMKYGSIDKSVKELQKYLNSHGFIVSITGAGSPGYETNYFGKATKNALGLFQIKNGIITAKMISSFGVFGPASQKFINNHP